MASSVVSALVFIVLRISSASSVLTCTSCPTPVNPPKHLPLIIKPPVHLPPVVVPVPPVTIPSVAGIPPIGNLPPVGGLPPVPLPIIVGQPPITVPPISKPEPTPCPSPPVKPANCPINILKAGACMELLSGVVDIGLEDPAANACCPVLKGLAELEAAACLCTTLKAKLPNIKVYVPIALQIHISCGKIPPPGYTCSI